MSIFRVIREIGIDAAHRVPTHGSKCKNVHGHRYTIEAHCEGAETILSGEQKDMILDFGWLKEEMMWAINDPCDHGIILWEQDPLVEVFRRAAERDKQLFFKMLVVPFIPTAEQLAKYWFEKLKDKVVSRSQGYATLGAIKVWETPNCSAVYIGEEG